eukprot:3849991-Rhodomonas_salina.1
MERVYWNVGSSAYSWYTVLERYCELLVPFVLEGGCLGLIWRWKAAGVGESVARCAAPAQTACLLYTSPSPRDRG